MKHRKLIAALCAAAISLAQLPATATGIPVTASAAETGALAELPDWIPDDFDSAVEFRNSFGVTHIGNGLLCLVFTEEKETAPEDDPRYQLKATKNVVQCLRDEVYSTEQSLFAMRVVVYQPKMQGVLSVTHTDKQAPANENAGYSFLIEITDPTYHTLSVTETDIYSWLPDCRTEFDEYVKAHGNVSAKDNYVIFCLKSGIGTAYEWREKSQDYESSFDFCTASSCSMVSGIPVAGGSSYEAVVYQAVEDGDAKIEWEYGSFYSDGKITNTLTADCVVTDNAQTVLLPHMMRIEFTDADYGSRANVPSELEPIPLQVSAELIGLAEGTDVVAALDIAPVTATRNPFIWDYSQFDGCRVKIDVSEAALPKNFHLADEYKKVTDYSNGAQNVEFMVRYAETIKGDLNGDGEFGIADAVLLSKWLLGLPDAAEPDTADYCGTGT